MQPTIKKRRYAIKKFNEVNNDRGFEVESISHIAHRTSPFNEDGLVLTFATITFIPSSKSKRLAFSVAFDVAFDVAFGGEIVRKVCNSFK